jgi:pyruvate/2-oxoglutarate dehydrogenase complex dihydrolipoamide acyltransferase (E2) component
MPKVQMPQLGESVAEGTIGKWLKKPGDHVDKYEPIVEVITDKVNAEVPSPFEGTLTEILVQEGETVPNNTDIAVIEGAAADAAAAPAPTDSKAAPAEGKTEPATGPYGAGTGPGGSDESPERSLEQPTAQPAPAPPDPAKAPAAPTQTAVAEPMAKSGGNGARAADAAGAYSGPTTPAVRRVAREHGVDLSMVAGSGHGGRVTREDVMKFVESGGAAAAAKAAPAKSAAPAPSAPSVPPTPSQVAQGDSLKQASPMRKAIAAQMTNALAIPVAYTVVEVDMSGVVALREATKGAYQSREGIGLTYDAIVAKATVEALKMHPDLNGHYTDEGHWRRASVNLGIAVAVEDGLVVPVIKDADRLSVHGLNRQIRDLADKARAGKLSLDDISGGTFTLDNTGWTGSLITQPIINAPQVGILTMESIVKRPVVVSTGPTTDAIAVKPMMYMCLGFDHRATDGAQAGRFISDVKRWLEAVDSSTAVW